MRVGGGSCILLAVRTDSVFCFRRFCFAYNRELARSLCPLPFALMDMTVCAMKDALHNSYDWSVTYLI